MTLHNRRQFKGLRKSLRNRATSAEAVLWTKLKDGQLKGRKFRRQHGIGRYIVDFYCPSEKIIVELDGEPHFDLEGATRDYERDLFLTNLGFTVLRFENSVVFDCPDRLLADIESQFKHH